MTAALSLLALFLVTTLLYISEAAHIEEVRANVDGSSSRKHENFVPLVSFKCGYRNKYMNEDGDWVDDPSTLAQCLEGKFDILKYCKRVYPGKDVTNIVEYSHEVQIEKWCKEEGGSVCKHTFTVRPYRCIFGEFVTESLQVPSKCHFGHVTGRTSCNDYSHWNLKAESECKQKIEDNKPMKLRSFAILEPCGLDLFRGVEFVCCPNSESQHQEKVVDLDKDVDEDEYDDDDEDDEDEDEPNKKESDAIEQDPYFKEDPEANEHERFKDAEERLEKRHRKKVTKVITEWSQLFERYNKMKEKDPKGAEEYKREMTARFRKTVAALEEENKEQRKQIETVHDERVQAALNEKKRQATHDYRAALALQVGANNKHNVLKTLKAYIRAEEKDRIHMLNRYRHLLRSDPDEASAFEPVLLHRLRYIDLRINGTLAMLHDFPELEKEVRPIAVEFWYEFRKENTPEVNDEELTSLGDEAKNERLVKLYKETYERSKPTTEILPPNPPTTTATTTTKSNGKLVELKDILAEDSDEDQFESDEDDSDEDDDKEDKPKKPIVLPRKEEPKKVNIDEIKKLADEVKKVQIEVEKHEPKKEIKKDEEEDVEEDDDDEDDDESDEVEVRNLDKDIHVAIEPIVSAPVHVHEETPIFPAYAKHDALIADGADPHEIHTLTSLTGGHTILVIALIACVGATMIVILMVKRYSRHHGFIEVDVNTPEERHISGMQVNGYENPTYSFFDSKP